MNTRKCRKNMTVFAEINAHSKKASTKNSDFSKGGVHKTDGFWWMIFQRGEVHKTNGLRWVIFQRGEYTKPKNHPSKPIGFVYSPLWKITHLSPSVLCTPPLKKTPIKSHRFCVLPPLKNHCVLFLIFHDIFLSSFLFRILCSSVLLLH